MNVMRRIFRSSVPFAVGLAALIAMSPALAVSPTPSTNDANKLLGWAHVNAVAGVGYVTLEFVSTRNFYSCFEVRSDGDTSQILTENGGNNYNTLITDGLYPYFCVKNSTDVETVFADGYVEVRMVFGAESDERFDWTTFDVLPDAATPDDCKDDGWMNYGFRNQGLCIQFVNTRKDSR